LFLILVDAIEQDYITKRFLKYAQYRELTSQLDIGGFRLAMRPFMVGLNAIDAIFRSQATR
jgi:hypothetical protein